MRYFDDPFDSRITGSLQIFSIGSMIPERVNIIRVMYKTDGEPLALYADNGDVYVWSSIVKVRRS